MVVLPEQHQSEYLSELMGGHDGGCLAKLGGNETAVIDHGLSRRPWFGCEAPQKRSGLSVR
jgi:hypothetical protein